MQRKVLINYYSDAEYYFLIKNELRIKFSA
jgi:hypothetical protein